MKPYLLFYLVLSLFSCSTTVPETSSKTQRLFLLSKGLTTENLQREFIAFLKADPAQLSVAVVPNATTKPHKMSEKTQKVKIEFAGIGFDSTKIQMVNIEAKNPEILKEFDIVYILGGNPFHLLDVVKKTKTDEVLRSLHQSENILMGYSAGTMLLGPNLEMFGNLDSLLGFNEMGLKNLEGINLYSDFEVFPHFKEFTAEVKNLDKAIEQYETQSKNQIIRLNDDMGIIVEGRQKRIIQ